MAKKEEKQRFELPANFIGNGENRLLPLQAQRVLFYGCWKYDEETSSSTFDTIELEKQFGVKFKNFESIEKALKVLKYYSFDEVNEEEQYIDFVNVFTRARFNKGQFTLNFNPHFKPQIKATRQQFLEYGLSIVSEWQCKYTVLLYNYMKEKMWDVRVTSKTFTLDQFRTLFKLEQTEYSDNKDFKLNCWEKSMKEINATTGYLISITPEGRGKKIKYKLEIQDKEQIISVQAQDKPKKAVTSRSKKLKFDNFEGRPEGELASKYAEIEAAAQEKLVNPTTGRPYRRVEKVPTYEETTIDDFTDPVDLDDLAAKMEEIAKKRVL